MNCPHLSGIVAANGIDIAYDSLGCLADPAILLIQGVGGQIEPSPNPLALALVAHGYRLVCFDNRDIGLSTKFDHLGVPDYGAIAHAKAQGAPAPLAYTIEDMAQDAIGLLDALKIERANIVGGSLGGAIAQVIAARHPERVISLTLISTTSGNPSLSYGPASNAMTPSIGHGFQTQTAHEVALAQLLEGPRYHTDLDILFRRAQARLRRSNYPAGVARQGVALAGDLRAYEARIHAPTMILHGADDPLFPPNHAHDIAMNIQHSQLRVVPGMGHTLPDALIPLAVDTILTAATRGGGLALKS